MKDRFESSWTRKQREDDEQVHQILKERERRDAQRRLMDQGAQAWEQALPPEEQARIKLEREQEQARQKRAVYYYDHPESEKDRDERYAELVRDSLNVNQKRRECYEKMEQASQAFERNAPSPAEQERQERARQEQAREEQVREERVREERAREEEARRAFQTDMRRQVQSLFSEVAPVVGVQRPPLPAANALPVAPLGNRPAGQSNLQENSMFGTLHRQMTTDPQGVFAALNQQLGTFGHNRNIPDSTQNSNSSYPGFGRR